MKDSVAEHEKVIRGQVKTRTLSDQMRALNVFMAHVGNNTQLKKISPRQAESFVASRLAAGVVIATVNKDIRTLKGIFNRAIDPRGYLSPGNNPFGKIRQRKKAEKPIKYVFVEEYQALIKAADSIWWKALTSAACGTGLRRDEILNLTWADIDFENHQLCSPKTDPV